MRITNPASRHTRPNTRRGVNGAAVDASGKGEGFYETRQTHVMCLALDREGNLLAGSVPNGLIYRISPQGKGFVLYQANLPEIHELAIGSDGRIYAAALGGAGGKGSPGLFLPPTVGTPPTAPVATVTITAGTDELSTRSSAETQTPSPGAQQPGSSFNRTAPQTPLMTIPRMPQGQGSLIQILPDQSVETLWSSKEESVFGLAVRGNDVLFSTDSNGSVFALSPSDDGAKLTLLTQTREALVTRLLLEGSDLYVATSNVGRLVRLGALPGREGSYESPVKDTRFVSRWGMMAWRAVWAAIRPR